MNYSNRQLRTIGGFRRTAIAHALAGATALLTIPSVSFATQYSLEYEVDARYRYNDNVGLRPNGEVDVHGAQITLPAKFSLTEDRYTAYANGELSSVKYNESGFNSDDQSLFLGGEYKFERGSITGNAGIDRSSTTETAFLDNGLVGASADRVERYSAGMTGTYYLSGKNALVSGVRYGDTNYDAARLIDNKYATAYVLLNHQYTEKTALQVQVNGNRFKNDAVVGIESDGVGLQAGFSTAFTEQFSVSMLGGYSQVDTEYDTPAGVAPREDDDSSGWVVSTTAEYKGSRSALNGSFVRRESASGDGYLIVSNRLSVEYDYKLTERVNLQVEAIAGNDGALDDRIDNDRKYISGRVRLSYQLAESWFLSATYNHRYQDRDRAAGDASSNQALASITYRPVAKVWSR